MVGCDSTINKNDEETSVGIENNLSKSIIPSDDVIDEPNYFVNMKLNQFDVELLYSKINKTEKSFDFYLKAYSNSTGSSFVNLNIKAYNENSFIGYTNTLSDNNNNLLWEYGLSIDTMQENHIRLFEKTQDDYLIIDRYVNENTIVEKYEINGSSKEFTLYTKDIEKISELNKLAFQSLNNKNIKNVKSLSSSDQMTLSTLEEFHEFYKTDNSLHDNIYGQLLVELIGNEDLQIWFQDKYTPDDINPQFNRWSDILCDAFNMCTALKCGFGGPINSVCDLCSIGSLSCMVMKFIRIW